MRKPNNTIFAKRRSRSLGPKGAKDHARRNTRTANGDNDTSTNNQNQGNNNSKRAGRSSTVARSLSPISSPLHHTSRTNIISKSKRVNNGTTSSINQKSSPTKWMKKLKSQTTRNSSSLSSINNNNSNNDSDFVTTNENNNTVGNYENSNSTKTKNINHRLQKISRTLSFQERKKRLERRKRPSPNPQDVHVIQSESEDDLTIPQSHQQQRRHQVVNHDVIDHDVDGHDDDDDDDDSACTQSSNDYDLESSRLTAIVWKRKSGFSGIIKSGYVKASERTANTLTLGMKSVTNLQKFMKVNNSNATDDEATPLSSMNGASGSGPASNIKIWEKRRIVLEGGILMYYHEDADIDVENEESLESSSSPTTTSGMFHPPFSFPKSKSLSKLKVKLIEISQASKFPPHNSNIGQTAENDHAKPISNSAINTPRGLIDLVANRASASATHLTPLSHSPTPYSLSIIVKSEAKWVLCFASSKELLSWLGALTDISLKQSLKSYQMDHGHAFCAGGHDGGDNDNKHENAVVRGGLSSHESISNLQLSISENGRNDTRSDPSGVDDQTNRNLVGTQSAILPQKSQSYDQYPFSSMIIINGILLSFPLMMKNILTVTSLLAVQAIINAVSWCYLYFRYKKMKQGNFDATARNADDFNSISPAAAIQTSMTSPVQMRSLRGRSFSSDDRGIAGQPSFVEITKDQTHDEEDDDPPYKPLAGETVTQVKNSIDAKNMKDGTVKWTAASSSSIQLRGSHYLVDRKKVPSPTSLYELIEVDIIDANCQMLDIGTKFQLPDVKFDSPQGNWRAPNLLVISFSLPTTAPKLGKASDNKGFVVTGYYRIRNKTREVLEILSNPEIDALEQEHRLREMFPDTQYRQRVNGIKLWEKWCRCAPTDQEMQKRLKFIPRGDNLREIGVPSWICKYNGKPMLMKRPGVTSFVFSHQDDNMMEIDINMHPLPYMFKQAMTYLKEHYFQQMMMTFGFVIEGRDDDELPEVLLGNPLQILTVNPRDVVKNECVFNRLRF
jgi:hypothetical protein